MIPLRDTAKTRTFPSVTVALIAANFLLFIQELRASPEFLTRIIFAYGLVPERFTHWVELGQPALSPARLFPFVTSMFLHGGWLHLLGNMLYLWIFGDNVEDRLGHLRFLGFYLACGFAAGLLQCWFDPDSPVPTLGASGAIAGVLGAYLVISPRAKIMTFIPIVFIPWILEIPAVVFLLIWFAVQLFSGLSTVGHGWSRGLNGGVAWWAHIGGFVAGMILILGAPRAPARGRGR